MKKRSFKLATAFAGAAAAAMGLGPTALAATALPASRHGSIRNAKCSAGVFGESHWIHLYYGNGHVPECFGYKGSITASANIAVACAGNNYGVLDLRSSPYVKRLFAGSTVSVSGKHVTEVAISFWSGHATCS